MNSLVFVKVVSACEEYLEDSTFEGFRYIISLLRYNVATKVLCMKGTNFGMQLCKDCTAMAM